MLVDDPAVVPKGVGTEVIEVDVSTGEGVSGAAEGTGVGSCDGEGVGSGTGLGVGAHTGLGVGAHSGRGVGPTGAGVVGANNEGAIIDPPYPERVGNDEGI